MSIRSRIEKFEALSKEREQEIIDAADSDSKNKKRFRFPDKTSETDTQPLGASFITNGRSPKKINDFQNYEADLQEVWSVRKNIHHTGGSKSIPSSNTSPAVLGSQVKSGLYSRHALQGHSQSVSKGHPQPVSKGPYSGNRGSVSGLDQASVESKRTPLQDFNSKESPWNVKKGGYSYNYQASVDNMAKRPIDSTSKAADLEPPFLPAAKRRINVGGDVMRPTAESKGTSFPLRGTDQSDKVNYAKRMAQGYLKSVGMGEFTPKSDGYSNQQASGMRTSAQTTTTPALSKWKKQDDDQEFDFDV